MYLPIGYWVANNLTNINEWMGLIVYQSDSTIARYITISKYDQEIKEVIEAWVSNSLVKYRSIKIGSSKMEDLPKDFHYPPQFRIENAHQNHIWWEGYWPFEFLCLPTLSPPLNLNIGE